MRTSHQSITVVSFQTDISVSEIDVFHSSLILSQVVPLGLNKTIADLLGIHSRYVAELFCRSMFEEKSQLGCFLLLLCIEMVSKFQKSQLNLFMSGKWFENNGPLKEKCPQKAH